MKSNKQIWKKLERPITIELEELSSYEKRKNKYLAKLVTDAVDTDREFLDKMFDRLENKYGEYLWK